MHEPGNSQIIPQIFNCSKRSSSVLAKMSQQTTAKFGTKELQEKVARGKKSSRGKASSRKGPTPLHQSEAIVAALKGAQDAASGSTSLEDVSNILKMSSLLDTCAEEIWRRLNKQQDSASSIATDCEAAAIAGLERSALDGPGPNANTQDEDGVPWFKQTALTAAEERSHLIAQLFEAMDGNRDHAITKQEFVDALSAANPLWGEFSANDAERLFDAMDNTRTGMLTNAKFQFYLVRNSITNVRTAFRGRMEMMRADTDRGRFDGDS